MTRTSLADILIDTGDLTPEQLTRAEALSAERQLPLPEVLLRQHMVSDDALLRAQGRLLGLTYWKELPDSEFDVPADATRAAGIRAAAQAGANPHAGRLSAGGH